MRFALVIGLILLNAAIFAVTNVTEVVYSPATNAVPVKVVKKAQTPVRPKCEAMTLSGNRCRRHAAEGSKYCSQHTAIIRKREKESGARKP